MVLLNAVNYLRQALFDFGEGQRGIRHDHSCRHIGQQVNTGTASPWRAVFHYYLVSLVPEWF